MDPDGVDVFPIEHGKFPAGYVSLPEGVRPLGTWANSQKDPTHLRTMDFFEVLYGCFLKWWYPQNTPKSSFLVGKTMIVGYHHFRKHPYARVPIFSRCSA